MVRVFVCGGGGGVGGGGGGDRRGREGSKSKVECRH